MVAEQHKGFPRWLCKVSNLALLAPALWSLALLPAVVTSGKQPHGSGKNPSGQSLQWAPPKVDAPLKSLSTIPPCNLSEVLEYAGANSQVLASNLQKFTAQERIEYVMLDQHGMPKESDTGAFNYVYWMEQQNGGNVSRESRTPVKGSHAFSASGQDIGQAAIALIFLPNLQTDYEMKCEGLEKRNGQLDWVVHFQQRMDRPSRTVRFWVDGVAYRGMFKGRAWISKENFQVIHLETNLMGDIPAIWLQELAISVDYAFVRTPSGKIGVWLPNNIVTYWKFDDRRIILVHSFDDFQLFEIETKEKTLEPK